MQRYIFPIIVQYFIVIEWMKAGLDQLIDYFTHVGNELKLYWTVKGMRCKTIMSRLYIHSIEILLSLNGINRERLIN